MLNSNSTQKKNIIFHIDVNSAYLSWEAIYRLSKGETLDIRTVPSVVAGREEDRHGIILAKSYPAKKYGIKTGETIGEARKKCPNLVVVGTTGDIYAKASQSMFDLLLEYSDNVQKYSIDEGFIDFSDNPKVLEDPYSVGEEIRKRIEEELGFTVCVGIGENKVMAKMAGELKKPNYTNTLYNNELHKLWPLPVGELFMVGRKTEEKLLKYGINTIGKLAKTDIKFLKQLLNSHGETIWNYANGRCNSDVFNSFTQNDNVKAKSHSRSTTLPQDINTVEEVEIIFIGLIEKVCTKLRKYSQIGSVITVSYKNTERLIFSQQRKIFSGTNNVNDVYKVALELFKELWNGENIRALGVSVSNLQDEAISQISLFDSNIEKKSNLDKTIDYIREKYGDKKIVRANQLNNPYYRKAKKNEFLHNLNVKF